MARRWAYHGTKHLSKLTTAGLLPQPRPSWMRVRYPNAADNPVVFFTQSLAEAEGYASGADGAVLRFSWPKDAVQQTDIEWTVERRIPAYELEIACRRRRWLPINDCQNR